MQWRLLNRAKTTLLVVCCCLMVCPQRLSKHPSGPPSRDLTSCPRAFSLQLSLLGAHNEDLPSTRSIHPSGPAARGSGARLWPVFGPSHAGTRACAATYPAGTPHGKPNKTPGHSPANPSLASSLSTRHLNHYTVLLLTLLAFDHLLLAGQILSVMNYRPLIGLRAKPAPSPVI